MLFRQLFDPESWTYTYLIADEQSGEAALIDPVKGQADRDEQLLRDLGLKLRYVLETHIHADHVTSAARLKASTGATTLVGSEEVACADRILKHGDELMLGSLPIKVIATPGHTPESLSFLVGDRVFTGDALLIRGCGRTDFQGGDSAALYRSVTQELFALPDETLVYPGHDYRGHTCSSIGEEKAKNPRLGGGKSLAAFQEIMANLNLQPPKKIDIAVPANRACGREEQSEDLALDKAEIMKDGIPQLRVESLLALERQPRLIDVRGPAEFDGELGHLPGAELVPLETVVFAAQKWDRDEELVLVCRSGQRSQRAAIELRGIGFEKVMNLQGGMIAVREQQN